MSTALKILKTAPTTELVESNKQCPIFQSAVSIRNKYCTSIFSVVWLTERDGDPTNTNYKAAYNVNGTATTESIPRNV